MIKKLLPILLLLIGTGAGVGAGVFLRPAQAPAEHAETGDAEGKHGATTANDEGAADGEVDGHGEKVTKAKADAHGGEPEGDRDYVKMSNQFVIPVVENGAVSSLVLLALSIEVDMGQRDTIFLKEPKLRDSFLQVLFDHANVGGFRGSFTENNKLDVLRAALREVAIRDAGDIVSDVLIHDIARQDY